MKWSALVAAGLLAAPSAALAHDAAAAPCPPGQVLAPVDQASQKQPVAGFDESQPPMHEPESFGKVVPSAKTPKPSRVRQKYSVASGSVPSAKTPRR